jgi:hypothetical protein
MCIQWHYILESGSFCANGYCIVSYDVKVYKKILYNGWIHSRSHFSVNLNDFERFTIDFENVSTVSSNSKLALIRFGPESLSAQRFTCRLKSLQTDYILSRAGTKISSFATKRNFTKL